MSAPQFPHSTSQAAEWLEDKLSTAGSKLCQKRRILENAIVRHPLPALAAGIGAGCLASRLPLARLTGSAIRLSLAVLPHALFVIGAARAWQMVRPLATPATREPGLAGWDPAEECVSVCNRLLAGEMSAVNACNHVVDHVQGEQAKADLQHVHAVHRDNSARLRELITKLGGRPVTADAQPVQVSSVSTDKPWDGLQELQQCNLQLMGDALRDPRIVEDVRSLILHHLQPRTQENIAALKRAGAYPSAG